MLINSGLGASVLLGSAGLFSLLLLVSHSAFAQPDMHVSEPAGTHTIGAPLEVFSTISGVPAGAGSQLRSTCLQARLVALEGNSSPGLPEKVFVTFQPTIAQGGTIVFKTQSPVNHALVRLELTSECPLIVFKATWPLIMTEQTVAAFLENIERAPQPGVVAFNPENSSLLAKSRTPPRALPSSHTEKPVEVVSRQVEPVATSVSDTEPEESRPHDAIKVVSLDQSLINHGLIASEPVTIGMGLELPAEEGRISSPIPHAYTVGGVIASLLTVLLFVGFYLRNRLSKSSHSISRSSPKLDIHTTKGAGLSDCAMDQKDLAANQYEYSTDRVLESLMGNDEALYLEDFLSETPNSRFGMPDSNESNALKQCLGLMNRADIRSWDLPIGYVSLVEERNKSLEMHRTPEALILRCQIGLVELAYQEAKVDRNIQAETSIELLQLLLGEQVYELECNTILGVPDLLKSYVKAKFCEVVGAEKRQLFRENLIRLNEFVDHQALCFHTNAWREFLTEEGLLVA